MKTSIKILGLGIFAGSALGAGGLSLYENAGTQIAFPEVHESMRTRTVLTSPLLECGELSQSISDQTLSSLRSAVQKLMTTRQESGDLSFASVYFRDLNNGPWFGINESEEFFPASLLKLPLAMSFYNKAEDDPSILTKEITYTPDPSTASQIQPFGPTRNVEQGKMYTVKDLLDIMLQESSNEAAVALSNIVKPAQITDVYHNLGLVPPIFGQDYKIDTHKYASFFRILYNATYVNKSSSESILKSLTDASFKDGLVAGVPQGVLVAHKFGSRQVDASGNTVQLHDCGIIYAPQKPYILCVMTQGTDFTTLAGFIKSVSESVYKNVAGDTRKE